MDVNAGVAVANSLQAAGRDVVFAGDLDWRMPDAEMLSLAHRDGRILLTFGSDFGELVYRSGRPHAGVHLLRMPGAARDEKVRVVLEILERYGERLPERFCVYRQGRLRIR